MRMSWRSRSTLMQAMRPIATPVQPSDHKGCPIMVLPMAVTMDAVAPTRMARSAHPYFGLRMLSPLASGADAEADPAVLHLLQVERHPAPTADFDLDGGCLADLVDAELEQARVVPATTLQLAAAEDVAGGVVHGDRCALDQVLERAGAVALLTQLAGPVVDVGGGERDVAVHCHRAGLGGVRRPGQQPHRDCGGGRDS